MDKLRVSLLVFGITGLSVALSGCGGDDGGACGVQPCGGNIQGSWTLNSACFNEELLAQEIMDEFADFCPSATMEVRNIGVSGTAAFNADATYSRSATLNLTFGLKIPTSCLMGLSCTQYSAAATLLVTMDPDSPIASFTCSGSNPCDCTVTMDPALDSESGTYSTSGTSLAVMPTGGTPAVQEYCVQGNTLHMLNYDATTMTIEADISGTRR